MKLETLRGNKLCHECFRHEVGFCSGGGGEPLKSKGKTKKLLEDSEQKTKLLSDTKYNCSFRYSISHHVVCRGWFTLPLSIKGHSIFHIACKQKPWVSTKGRLKFYLNLIFCRCFPFSGYVLFSLSFSGAKNNESKLQNTSYMSLTPKPVRWHAVRIRKSIYGWLDLCQAPYWMFHILYLF